MQREPAYKKRRQRLGQPVRCHIVFDSEPAEASQPVTPSPQLSWSADGRGVEIRLPEPPMAHVVVKFLPDGLVKIQQFRPDGQRDASYAPVTVEQALARQLPQALAECREMALSAAEAGGPADPDRA